jgi:hypothetical protein
VSAPTVSVIVHVYPTGKPGLVNFEVLSEGPVSPTAEETVIILRQAANHIEENPAEFIEYQAVTSHRERF